MPGTGVSSAAVLTRRLQFRARAGHYDRKHIDVFCAEQLERIHRISNKQIARVHDARRRAVEHANRQGCELEISIRGAAGSDAHPDDEVPRV